MTVPKFLLIARLACATLGPLVGACRSEFQVKVGEKSRTAAVTEPSQTPDGAKDPTPRDPFAPIVHSPALLMEIHSSDFEIRWTAATNPKSVDGSLSYQVYFADPGTSWNDAEAVAAHAEAYGEPLVEASRVVLPARSFPLGSMRKVTVVVSNRLGRKSMYEWKTLTRDPGALNVAIAAGSPLNAKGEATRSSPLTCTTDMPGAVVEAVQWYRDQDDIAHALPGQNAVALATDVTRARGHVFVCRMSAKNANGDIYVGTSPALTIGNAEPELASVSLSSSDPTPLPGSTLTCAAITHDGDGDAVTATILFTGITGTQANPYTVQAADVGRAISCQATLAANADGHGSAAQSPQSAPTSVTPIAPVTLAFSGAPTLDAACLMRQNGTAAFETGFSHRPAGSGVTVSGFTPTSSAADDTGFQLGVPASALTAGATFGVTWTVGSDFGTTASLSRAYAIDVAFGTQAWAKPTLPGPSSSLLPHGSPGQQPDATGNLCLQGIPASFVSGTAHTCALKADGKVICWGGADAGQRGQGLAATDPVRVIGLDGSAGNKVQDLRLGNSHACALLVGGKVRCWGSATDGALGNGTLSPSIQATPSDVSGIDGTTGNAAVAIDAGLSHTCAAMDSGKVRCWGDATAGALGNGATSGKVATPVEVSGITGAAGDKALAVATGSSFSCAVMDSGRVKCWGLATGGVLGNGQSSTDAPVPVDVSVIDGTAGKKAVAITTTWNAACALMDNGTVRCWGSAVLGQLGNGTTSPDVTTPALVSNISGAAGNKAVRISGGNADMCVVMDAGTIRCWGDNYSGKLGHDQPFQLWESTPVTVVNIDGTVGKKALDVTTGSSVSCAVLDSGKVQCWGAYGAILGIGNANISSSVPIDHAVLDGTGSNKAVRVATRNVNACAILQDESVMCWGNPSTGVNGGGFTRTAPPSPTEVLVIDGTPGKRATALAAGSNHTCAILDSGGIKCWGDGSAGRLGNGSAPRDRSSPVDVLVFDGTAGKTAVAIAAGAFHTCAVTDVGTVKCWGSSTVGQVGNGTTGTNYTSPVDVSGIDGAVGNRAVGIAAGGNSSCAMLDSGRVKCWGAGAKGQLGHGATPGSQSTPVLVNVLDGTAGKKAVALTVGNMNACAITDAGTVQCWGDAANGRLGNGTTAPNQSSPVAVTGFDGTAGKTAVALASGEGGSCAVTDSGTLKCWGKAANGVLGNGTATPDATTPVDVLNLGGSGKKVLAVSRSMYFTCALTQDGQASCWGLPGTDGMLGNGATGFTSQLIPDGVVAPGEILGGQVLTGLARRVPYGVSVAP